MRCSFILGIVACVFLFGFAVGSIQDHTGENRRVHSANARADAADYLTHTCMKMLDNESGLTQVSLNLAAFWKRRAEELATQQKVSAFPSYVERRP